MFGHAGNGVDGLSRRRQRAGGCKGGREKTRPPPVNGVRYAGQKPAGRPRVRENAGKRDVPHQPTRASGPARAEHPRHHARNLNSDGPGDRHVHQIDKERREQRTE